MTTQDLTRVRSNLLLDLYSHDFLKKESKKRGISKGRMVSLAIKAFKKSELKKSIKSFYNNSLAKKEDLEMAEEGLTVN